MVRVQMRTCRSAEMLCPGGTAFCFLDGHFFMELKWICAMKLKSRTMVESTSSTSQF